jgi:NAD(P) transhydrogenase subunit alpha
LYSKNLTSLIQLLINKEKALQVDFADDIVDAACITHAGEIRNQRVRDALQAVSGVGAAQ